MMSSVRSPLGSRTILAAAFGLAVLAGLAAWPAAAEERAKDLFGAKKLPAATSAQSIGFYSKGCFAGGVAIPMDGPTWEVMRPSRNRRWGHPAMIALIEKLSRDAAADGWPGLLIGDISQPRGGPMMTGHASHQIGLDADIWLTPMPSRPLSMAQRESMSATLMVDEKTHLVKDALWTPQHTNLLKRAASYPEVERILVNPGIKKSSATPSRGIAPGCARSGRSGATTIISTCASAASRARQTARRRRRHRAMMAAASRWPGGSPNSPGVPTRTPMRRKPATS